MKRSEYDRFTKLLVEALSTDDRVIGLVALGSMAAIERQPDEWSDHDFWLVTRNGQAAAVRADISWLPRSEHIAIAFAESGHGRSAVYDDGHLVEFAVFDDDDVEIARANTYRVLIDRCGLDRRMRTMVERTSADSSAIDPTGADRFGAFLAQITIGVTRHGRGELLSAHQLVRGSAARTLTSLLGSFVDAAVPGRLDNLDPSRRFEQAHPTLAAEIDVALGEPTLQCANSLVALAQRELDGRIPSVSAASVGAVRTTISRACAARPTP